MLLWLVHCVACKGSITDWATLPLCTSCCNCLVDCPPLCKTCGLLCTQECLFPWRKGNVDQFSARYLLMGQGYQVLKCWKIHPGPFFDRLVLKNSKELCAVFQENPPDLIIPMPQLFHRSWILKGNRAEHLAHWISNLIHVPTKPVLLLKTKNQRQAPLSLEQRISNQITFNIQPGSKLKRILLVDDFRTTGRTASFKHRYWNHLNF
jgi:predicted amidophosphoribosyltransferase